MSKIRFNNRLSQLRKRDGLTQQELADKLNVSYVAISNYEAGKREPDLDKLNEICDYFDVSMDYLIGRSQNEHGLIVKDTVNGHLIEAEVDNRKYPNGWTHDQVCKALEQLKKAGIEIKID